MGRSYAITGMPWLWACWVTWMPAPFRSVSTIRLQPDVSICWAIVAYLPVSFSAFWMLILKPAASNCFFSSGASLCTQRLELSASGMIAHTVFGLLLVDFLPPPLLAELPLLSLSLLPQPAKTNAPAAASAASAVNRELIILRPLLLQESSTTLDGIRKCFGRGTVLPAN